MSLETQVQDALVTQLAAHCTGVAVSLGFPMLVQAEHVWVSGETTSDWTQELSGWSQHDETGTVRVILVVTRRGEYVTPRDRAFAIGELVKAAIAHDRTLGGIVERTWVERVESSEAVTESERQVGLAITVRYTGTVTG